MFLLTKPIRWIARHAVLAMLMLVALALIVRLGWGWQVSAELNRRLAQIRSRNQPVSVEQVVYPSIAPMDNAWPLQMQATAALAVGVVSPSNEENERDVYPLTDTKWLALAQTSEKSNGPAFALARRARSRNGVGIRNSIPSPMISITLPYLQDIRNLACTLIDAAVYAHSNHNDDEAIERLLDALHVARSVHHDDFLVCQLVATGIDLRIYTAARIIFSDMHSVTSPNVPANTRQLIAQLEDEEAPSAGLARSIQLEQLFWIDFYRDRARENWVLRPLAERDTMRTLKNVELFEQAGQCVSYPPAKRILEQMKIEPFPFHDNFGRWTEGQWVPRYSRWFDNPYAPRDIWYHYRALAERRSTVVALAAHLYRLDHGRWPSQLADLVPTYLSALPADPFAEDGHPIGYLIATLPNGASRPLVFFDTGMTNTPIPAEPTFKWYPITNHWGGLRQYRDLTYFDPALLKKAVDGDPNQPNAPGNNRQPSNNRQ